MAYQVTEVVKRCGKANEENHLGGFLKKCLKT